MEPALTNAGRLAAAANDVARRLLSVDENRLELLIVDGQEERDRFLHAMRVALGVAAFGLLAGVALTGAILVLFWELSRVAALLVLASLYGVMAAGLYQQLLLLLRDWQDLPATLDQSRKDRACHENISRRPVRIGEAIVLPSGRIAAASEGVVVAA
jgi:uncharacterized membrane protein YqjE